MALVTAEERLRRPRGATVAMVAEPGVGKTFQARFLRGHDGCVFLDMEAGTMGIDHPLALPDGQVIPAFGGATIEGVRSWEYAQALAMLVAGPDPSREPGESFSEYAVSQAREKYPEEARALADAHTVFWDSMSYLSRMCYEWCVKQPQARTAKGAFDQWGAYRLLADEMVRVVRSVQQQVVKRNIFAMILDRDKSGGFDFQLHGQATSREILGVFDIVVAMVEVISTPAGVFLAHGSPPDTPRFRAFVCKKENPFGLPVKDRSTRLEMFEPPDIGALLDKLRPATTY